MLQHHCLHGAGMHHILPEPMILSQFSGEAASAPFMIPVGKREIVYFSRPSMVYKSHVQQGGARYDSYIFSSGRPVHLSTQAGLVLPEHLLAFGLS